VLGGLRNPARNADCSRANTLITEVLKLPNAQQRLAIRLIFEQG